MNHKVEEEIIKLKIRNCNLRSVIEKDGKNIIIIIIKCILKFSSLLIIRCTGILKNFKAIQLTATHPNLIVYNFITKEVQQQLEKYIDATPAQISASKAHSATRATPSGGETLGRYDFQIPPALFVIVWPSSVGNAAFLIEMIATPGGTNYTGQM